MSASKKQYEELEWQRHEAATHDVWQLMQAAERLRGYLGWLERENAPQRLSDALKASERVVRHGEGK